jgi:hypothetical protein
MTNVGPTLADETTTLLKRLEGLAFASGFVIISFLKGGEEVNASHIMSEL